MLKMHRELIKIPLEFKIENCNRSEDRGQSKVTREIPTNCLSIPQAGHCTINPKPCPEDVSHYLQNFRQNISQCLQKLSNLPDEDRLLTVSFTNGVTSARVIYKPKLHVLIEGNVLKNFRQELGLNTCFHVEILQAKVTERRTLPGQHYQNNRSEAGPLALARGGINPGRIYDFRRRDNNNDQERVHADINDQLVRNEARPRYRRPNRREIRGNLRNPADGDAENQVGPAVVLHIDADRDTRSRAMGITSSDCGGTYCEDYIDFPTQWWKYWLVANTETENYTFEGTLKISISKAVQYPQLTVEDAVAVNRRLLEEKLACDMTIIAKNGESIKCHSAFLIAHSSVFKVAIEGNFPGSISGTLNLEDMSESSVHALLDYLYCSNLKEAMKDFDIALELELLEAGHKYEIAKLEKEIKEMILRKRIEEIDISQGLDLYVFAKKVTQLKCLEMKAVEALKLKVPDLLSHEKYKQLFLEAPLDGMDLCSAFAVTQEIKTCVE